MPIWIRVDANFDSHPKAIAAGKWGRRATQALWRATKLHGKRGTIPATFVTGAWLAEFTRDGDEDAADYERGICAAIEVGFIEPQEDGTYFMHDWPDYQIDQTAAKRQREHRENTSGGSSDVTDVTRDHRDVTLSRLQDRTGQDRTGQKSSSAPSGAGTKVNEGKRARFIDDLCAKVRAVYADSYQMAPSIDDGPLRAVVGHVVKVAKSDGHTANAEVCAAEVLRIIGAYLNDQDEFLTRDKHPLTMLKTEKINRYRRPMARKAANG